LTSSFILAQEVFAGQDAPEVSTLIEPLFQGTVLSPEFSKMLISNSLSRLLNINNSRVFRRAMWRIMLVFLVAISSMRADCLMFSFQAGFPELTCDHASETGKDIDVDDWFIQGRRKKSAVR